jgi:hypothetical protein
MGRAKDRFWGALRRSRGRIAEYFTTIWKLIFD